MEKNKRDINYYSGLLKIMADELNVHEVVILKAETEEGELKVYYDKKEGRVMTMLGGQETFSNAIALNVCEQQFS